MPPNRLKQAREALRLALTISNPPFAVSDSAEVASTW